MAAVGKGIELQPATIRTHAPTAGRYTFLKIPRGDHGNHHRQRAGVSLRNEAWFAFAGFHAGLCSCSGALYASGDRALCFMGATDLFIFQLDVHARRLVAPDWEHVGAVDLRG